MKVSEKMIAKLFKNKSIYRNIVIAEYGDILYFIVYKNKEKNKKNKLIIDTRKVIVDIETQKYIKLINMVIGKKVGVKCEYDECKYKLIYIKKNNKKL